MFVLIGIEHRYETDYELNGEFVIYGPFTRRGELQEAYNTMCTLRPDLRWFHRPVLDLPPRYEVPAMLRDILA